MPLIPCPECGASVSDKAISCPNCGYPMKPAVVSFAQPPWRGWEWKSKIRIFGIPLIHIAFGRDKQTGKWLVAKGIIAIGQFGLGVITFAQFGFGLLFGFGQFLAAPVVIAQFALSYYFAIGQFAVGLTAIGQIAFGKYVRAQMGYGEYVWSAKIKNPEAIEYFTRLWSSCKDLIGK
jgi:hypothetical protein